MTLIKKLKEKKDVALATAYVGCTYAMTSTCYAAGTDLDIKTVITNALNLVFGVLVFGGVIGAITGIRGIAKGVQDDGSGPDSQAVSKGKGQLIAGIIMMAPVPVFKVLTGQTPSAFVGSFF